MRRLFASALSCSASLAALACGDVVKSAMPDAAATPDAPAMRRCDPTKRFGDEAPLGGLGDFELQQSVTFTASELTAYVALAHLPAPGASPDFDIYKATRGSDVAEFSTLIREVGVSTTDTEPDVSISEDGKLMVIARAQAGRDADLYEIDANPDGSFSTVTRADALSTTGLDEGRPSVWGGAQTLYFARYVDDVKLNDLFYAVRSGGEYAAAVEVPGVNSNAYENGAVASASGLELLFNRDDVMYSGVRASTSDPFAVAKLLDDSNTQIAGSIHWLSLDGCRLYYSRATYDNDQLVSSRLFTRSRPR